MSRLGGARVSVKQSVVQKAIPLCGIVLVLGITACNRVTYASGEEAFRRADEVNQELVATIQDFLSKVPANQRETYDRFFADDVIYTRNSGQVVYKKEILADAGNPAPPRANATYNGENFVVHQYGDTAIVNFRLVMHGTDKGNPVTRSFRNTGTFMKRNGQWQAIAWQATPIAEQKEQKN